MKFQRDDNNNNFNDSIRFDPTGDPNCERLLFGQGFKQKEVYIKK